MSDISNRAIFIAVSLLVTIAITSSIMIVMGYFKDVYKVVGTTDISIRKMFNEFDMYDNTVITGLDALNLCNKYKNDPYVKVTINSVDDDIKNRAENVFKLEEGSNTYYTYYSSHCTRGDITVINLIRK